MSVISQRPALKVTLEFTRDANGVEIVIWSANDLAGPRRGEERFISVWKVPMGRIDQAILQEIETVLDAVIDHEVDTRFGTQMVFSG